LLITGCDEPTAHAEKEYYLTGEEIVVYDNVSNAMLARMTITDISVIEDRSMVIDGTPYEAIVQMTYTASTAAGHPNISSDNFEIYDTNGNSVWIDPNRCSNDTGGGSIVFAVEEKGDYVTVCFHYYKNESVIATITAEYEEGKLTRENTVLKVSCIVLGVAIAALVVAIVILPRKKRKDLSSVKEEEERGPLEGNEEGELQ